MNTDLMHFDPVVLDQVLVVDTLKVFDLITDLFERLLVIRLELHLKQNNTQTTAFIYCVLIIFSTYFLILETNVINSKYHKDIAAEKG